MCFGAVFVKVATGYRSSRARRKNSSNKCCASPSAAFYAWDSLSQECRNRPVSCLSTTCYLLLRSPWWACKQSATGAAAYLPSPFDATDSCPPPESQLQVRTQDRWKRNRNCRCAVSIHDQAPSLGKIVILRVPWGSMVSPPAP